MSRLPHRVIVAPLLALALTAVLQPRTSSATGPTSHAAQECPAAGCAQAVVTGYVAAIGRLLP